eukprot:3353716-Amphidinium_carterae.1
MLLYDLFLIPLEVRSDSAHRPNLAKPSEVAQPGSEQAWHGWVQLMVPFALRCLQSPTPPCASFWIG